MQRKKLPPYGKPLRDFLKSGGKLDNDVYLFIGNDAWEKGKSFSITQLRRTLVLPPYDCPTNYLWPVRDCDILIFDSSLCDDDYIEDLMLTLFACEANIVRYTSLVEPIYLSTFKRTLS